MIDSTVDTLTEPISTFALTGDGQLHSVTETRGGHSTVYLYQYDTLGNLVSSEKLEDNATVLRTWHSYDMDNRLSSQGWQLGADSYTQTYSYDTWDGNLSSMQSAAGQTLTYSYDGLRRLTSVDAGPFEKSYTYRNLEDGRTTGQVSSVTYDNAGNILYGNGHSYTYGDGTWADLLTAVDGKNFTYDAIGNPTNYYNGTWWSFGWQNGRQLTSASSGINNISYTYDADGLRTGKTVNGTEYTYHYAGGKLMRETYGTITLDFFYDAGGYPFAIKYNGTVFYYITNLQGDVMAIVNANGNVLAQYEYDPYGNIVSQSGPFADINPLRYRGYVYDSETRFYYLQSRYYDPELGRFLNADSYASTGQGVLGNNMFAYCGNNCVNMHDPDGKCSRFLGCLWLVDCGQPSCETSKSNPNCEPGFFEKFLTHMARPREEGNTFSVGFSGGYSGVGFTAGESGVISVDTSHNYAFQRTTTSGAASGAGGSAGLVMTYTNATNVHDLEGYSESTGFTFVAIGGMTIDFISFSPSSKPGTTCWGISVVISAGGEFEGHTAKNFTTSTESWNPFLALRDRLYGG